MNRTVQRLAAVGLTAGLALAPLPLVANAQKAIDAASWAEAWPLMAKTFEICQYVALRERRHAEDLRKRNLVEDPPALQPCYVIRAPGVGFLAFNAYGELDIDRRFVTDYELQYVRALERWIVRWLPPKAKKSAQQPHLPQAPMFRGFEDARYQQHDALIARLVAEFNAGKADWCDGTDDQASLIPDLSPAFVKAHMIEESGGNDPRSRAAWEKDPLQVNVPGDWGEEKELVGLAKPSRRNEGTLENNVRAALKYLARKGFSAAARPARERKKGYFDGWGQALRRYNGRRDRTGSNRYYSEAYAENILRRASRPDIFVPVERKTGKKQAAP